MRSPSLPLHDLTVVDLSGWVAGAYCTKLLADAGADVVKLEDPEGDPLRRWSASGAVIPEDGDGALFGFLSCSKQSVVADARREEDLRAVADLLDAADAVVWSPGTRLAAAPSLAPAALRRTHGHLLVTSITPFGLEGPWSGRPATEFTLQAWSGGIIGLGRGAPEREPLSVGGQIGEWLAGVFAVIGTMVSRARGGGDLIDISMLEVLALCMTYYPVTFSDIMGHPYRSGRALPVPGVETALDGLVGLGTGTGQQWLDLCAMIGHPEWADDQSLRRERASIAPVIREWLSNRSVGEILDLASSFRIPHAPIGNGATLPSTDHFQARVSYIANPRDGFVQPDHPYRFVPPLLRPPQPYPRLGQHTARLHSRRQGATSRTPPRRHPPERPFAGLRILDMTAFWAGPLCTHILAMLGADVIHLESPSRPDGTRLLSGLPFTEDRWWERSGIFSGINTNKRSLALDLNDPRARTALRSLIATCDVIVENYSPRVLEQAGLGYEEVRGIRKDIVMVRMPGFGLDGPWRDKAAFAFTIEDASGLTWMTGFPDANPVSPYCVGDPLAATHALAGLLLALEHRRRTGEGVLVEAAMIDAALNVTAEQVVEYSACGALLERDGNSGPLAAPQNLYLAADTCQEGRCESWVAVAVATDEQWRALVAALGQPAWATDPRLGDRRGRRRHSDAIDANLAAWCRGRSSDEIVARLWGAGVPVAKVTQPEDQPDLPQLRFRRFFETVEHPVSGPARHSTLPIRFSRGPDRFHLSHAPLFGDDTEKILAELGYTDAAIRALAEDGVTATHPRM